MKDPRSILVLHPGSMGDLLLAIGAVAALRRRFPRARLEVAAGSPARELLPRLGVDAVHPLERPVADRLFVRPVEPKASNQVEPKASDRVVSALPPPDFDLIVCWMADAEGVVAESIARSGAAGIVARPLSCAGALHRAEAFLRTLAPLGIRPSERPDFPILPRRKGDEFLGRVVLSRHAIESGYPVVEPKASNIVVLLPGAGAAAKRWPAENHVRLAGLLAEIGARTAAVVGPAEPELAGRLGRLTVLSDLSIPELVGVFSLAALVIGQDSGVTHLAAVLGRPTLALFGPTDPGVWGPRGPHVTVLRSASPGGAMTDIPIEDVAEAARSLLGITGGDGCLKNGARGAGATRHPGRDAVRVDAAGSIC